MSEKNTENKSKKTLWQYILPVLKNKYTITLLVFLIWITIFDKNNLIERRADLKVRNQLVHDKNYFKEQIENDKQRINELMSNDDNLEKFAREQYLMKKENEDIYVILRN